MTNSKLKEKFEKKWYLHDFDKKNKTFTTVGEEVWNWIDHALTEARDNGIVQGHWDESEDRVWYINEAVKEERKLIIKEIKKRKHILLKSPGYSEGYVVGGVNELDKISRLLEDKK